MDFFAPSADVRRTLSAAHAQMILDIERILKIPFVDTDQLPGESSADRAYDASK
jgi:hypothetical protein